MKKVTLKSICLLAILFIASSFTNVALVGNSNSIFQGKSVNWVPQIYGPDEIDYSNVSGQIDTWEVFWMQENGEPYTWSLIKLWGNVDGELDPNDPDPTGSTRICNFESSTGLKGVIGEFQLRCTYKDYSGNDIYVWKNITVKF